MKNKIESAIKYLTDQVEYFPKLAIILGSGLGPFSDHISDKLVIDTLQIPFYPKSTVEGHAGSWIVGNLENRKILALKGRIHFYEGYSIQDVTFPIQLLAELGITHLIITNAAGGLNLKFQPGDLMLINDHINFSFKNPLVSNDPLPPGKRFVDMSEPYDQELIQMTEETGLDLGIQLQKGVLINGLGPSYETAAEVRMLRMLGGDAATMSTVPEVLVANQNNMKVLGISCITNLATGMTQNRLDHLEVTEIAAQVSDKFQKLIKGVIKNIYDYSLEN